jgi:hypothetical protein
MDIYIFLRNYTVCSLTCMKFISIIILLFNKLQNSFISLTHKVIKILNIENVEKISSVRNKIRTIKSEDESFLGYKTV